MNLETHVSGKCGKGTQLRATAEGQMFKFKEDHVAVLGICVDLSYTLSGDIIDFRLVTGGRRAMDLLRTQRFDLLLIRLTVPDMSIWNLLRRLKTDWPQQKWALVGGPISYEQEITVRMFGATAMFDAMPGRRELLELVARIRAKATDRALSGNFDGDAAAASYAAKAAIR